MEYIRKKRIIQWRERIKLFGFEMKKELESSESVCMFSRINQIPSLYSRIIKYLLFGGKCSINSRLSWTNSSIFPFLSSKHFEYFSSLACIVRMCGQWNHYDCVRPTSPTIILKIDRITVFYWHNSLMITWSTFWTFVFSHSLCHLLILSIVCSPCYSVI